MNVRRTLTVCSAIAVTIVAAAPRGAVADPPVWSSPMALGPTDATSLAARPGLVLAGGRPTIKNSFDGGTEQVPGPRVAGLFRSTDQGRTWTLGRDLGQAPITDTPGLVAVSGNGPEAYATFGQEAWRSDDQGVTWRKVGMLGGSPTTLDVLADGRVVAGLVAGGVRVSGDRGETWAPLGTGLPSSRVNEVVQLGNAPATILVATDTGVYRSTDTGATFTQATTGIAQPGSAALGVAQTSTSAAWLAMPGATLTATQLYTSSDGATWQPRGQIFGQNLLPRVNRGALDMTVQGSLYVLYAGTTAGLYRSGTGTSTPQGVGWERIDPEPGAEDVGEMAVEDLDPSPTLRNDVVYATVKRASPAAVSSTETRLVAPGWYDELEGGRICGGVVARPSAVFAACGRHVFRSTDGGGTWIGVTRGLPYVSAGIGDTPYMPLEAGADGSLWTSCYHCGLYRSNAAVTGWSKVPFPGASAGSIATHPTDAQRAYVAGLGTNGADGILWRTTDGGTTWQQIRDIGRNIYTIDTTPAAPSKVLVATYSNSAWVSDNAGDTWQRATGLPQGTGGLTGGGLYRAYFSDADANRVWALASGSDSDFALYRSDDGGRSFTEVGPLRVNGVPIATFEITPSPWDRDTVYSTTIGGDVIVSRDAGESFAMFDSGLPKVACSICEDVMELTFDPTVRGRMYIAAGVMGSGADPESAWIYRGEDPQV